MLHVSHLLPYIRTLRLFIVMRHQQNKEESQDEFEEIREEVETITTHKVDSPPKNPAKNHPRLHHFAEKHKLGLVASLQKAESIHPHQKKQAPVPIGKIIKIGSAIFRSNFESGSLGNVDLVGNNSFRITLDAETNSSRGNTWFDFIVEGVKGEACFTIAGFRKRSSLYNQGMKICYRQLGESRKWKRGGTHISYSRETSGSEQVGNRFQIKFSFCFKLSDHKGVEFAYCFPYGLSKLHQLLNHVHSKTKIQTIASSFEGIDIPLINLGNLASEEVIILSARVHPGETVSSFIMQGFLKEMVSDCEPARFLREKFLFKIMPMINVDGVRHGNFRFSASGVDLNRRWKIPSQEHYPEIYYLKQMILREHKQKRVRMFIDMHGHSRKKNVFFYGCCKEGHNLVDNFEPKAFPFLVSKIHEPFSYPDCSFNIQSEKEGTARIALWNQLKIHQIYTLEASFCSSAKGNNYSEADYEKMGHKLCESMALYFYQSSPKYPHLAKAVAFREKVYAQLRNDPLLLKQGNQQNSGSDSQPEKGEKTDRQKEKDESDKVRDKHVNMAADYHILVSSAKQETVQSIRYQNKSRNSNKPTLHLEVPLSESISINHKSEAAVSDDRGQIEPEHMKLLFPPLPRFSTIKTDNQLDASIQDKYVPQVNKHIRVHHPVKGSSVPVAKIAFNGEEILHNEEEQHPKDKRMVSAFENTQYRRIKNMVEQRFAQKLGRETPVTMVQSINTRRIEVEAPRQQGIIARFYANTPMKKRKNSVEVFYNKPSKTVSRPHKEQANVMCRGRQIMF